MKILALIVVLVAIAGAVVYENGAHLPQDHSVSVSGVVPAPPEQVFALITDVRKGPEWRPEVKSVTVLDQVQGQDHWVEHLNHGKYMTFLATQTQAPTRREVTLDQPEAPYGGKWLYELSPGPSPASTTLRITETGYIRPPLYRFIMAHIIGPRHNLDAYMKDLQAALRR